MQPSPGVDDMVQGATKASFRGGSVRELFLCPGGRDPIREFIRGYWRFIEYSSDVQ
jgi:hypothetical protein